MAAIKKLVRWAQVEMRGEEVTPNPCLALASAESLAWADAQGLAVGSLALRRLEAIRCGSCAAHTYPSAPPEVVTLGAKLITWLYLFDDAYGEGRDAADVRDLMATLASFENVVRGARMPARPTPFHRALLDLRTDCVAIAPSNAWIDRFGDSLARYFDGCVLESQFRTRGQAPTLTEYRRIRAWSIGTFPVFDLIELATRTDVELDPELDAIRERAALLCAWVNDVYSFRKEQKDGETLNLVALLAREYEIDVGAAFQVATEVFNTDLVVFEEDARALSERRRDAAPYVAGLRDWVHGNYTWTALCRRYP
ncbi:MAG: hypothetical protein AB7S26_42515 [Sandaracinaceae bacterium]